VSHQRKARSALAVVLAGGLLAAVPAQAAPPGPGDKQCSPGQNNVGGGPGASGPGDKNGAPLKAPPSCPGG
jgi:hypothetical protein